MFAPPRRRAAAPDALERRVTAELDRFTNWLEANDARGYVGEVGWPDAASGDAAKWNDLADRWYEKADASRLWVTGWATGEWWGRNYDLSIYENRAGDSESGVETANTQASTFEDHPDGSRLQPGHLRQRRRVRLPYYCKAFEVLEQEPRQVPDEIPLRLAGHLRLPGPPRTRPRAHPFQVGAAAAQTRGSARR